MPINYSDEKSAAERRRELIPWLARAPRTATDVCVRAPLRAPVGALPASVPPPTALGPPVVPSRAPPPSWGLVSSSTPGSPCHVRPWGAGDQNTWAAGLQGGGGKREAGSRASIPGLPAGALLLVDSGGGGGEPADRSGRSAGSVCIQGWPRGYLASWLRLPAGGGPGLCDRGLVAVVHPWRMARWPWVLQGAPSLLPGGCHLSQTWPRTAVLWFLCGCCSEDPVSRRQTAPLLQPLGGQLGSQGRARGVPR